MVCNGSVPALDEPLKKILGGNTAKVMAEHLGLETVGDLLHHYPRRYEERGQLTRLADLPLDEHVTVVAQVAKATVHKFNRGRGQRLEVVLTDGSGQLRLVFFGRGIFKPQKDLLPGRRGMFAGKVGVFNGRLQLAHPQYELLGSEGGAEEVDAFANRLMPIYPAVAQLASWKIAKSVRTVLASMESTGWDGLVDPLPPAIRDEQRLIPLPRAFEKVHRPHTNADVAEARARLKWDEAFVLQVALARRRQAESQLPAVPRVHVPDGLLDAFDAKLPFTLTEGQRHVSAEIFADLAAEHPMHRLLQGEVGSGKAQPLDALVLTPGGFREMGTISPGDEVVTPSGELAPVDGVFPQGEREVWRLVLSDGSSVECDDEHLWLVGAGAVPRLPDGQGGTPPPGGPEASVLTTREIRCDLTRRDGSPKWWLPESVPVDLGAPADVPADPYETGLLLGRQDAEGGVPRPFREASVKDRLAVLRGLLEGLPHVAGGSGTDEETGPPAARPEGAAVRAASRRLAEDVAWLVRSLSGHASVAPAGPVHDSGGPFDVTVQLPPQYPALRHTDEPGGQDHGSQGDGGEIAGRAVVGVEPAGRKQVQCISVRHPSRAYVTDNFTVTHNTMVALRAMLTVVDSGGQAALLAPTEVLAQQHHRSVTEMMGELAEGGMLGGAEQGTKVVLLTGSMGAAARRRALLELATGEAGIVIGTHALIEDKVQFHDLGLVVVDEQHRFGVEQRDALRSKGRQPPHLLVMTATPIPRTVAMTVFGDLETSVLDQLPAGRSPIATHVVPARDKPHFLARTWERVREETEAGHQTYVVCPRIGDEAESAGAAAKDGKRTPVGPASRTGGARESAGSEDAGAYGGEDGGEEGGEVGEADKRPPLAVLDIAAQLGGGPLSGLRVEALHGRMQPDAKDDVMRRFAAGEVDVLVATTVIEVGVNVPNATVMVIMDADRFGVSQLHQLRGRVGRGSAAGLCLLVTEAPEAGPSRARLEAVAGTLDGFELSRIDLEQRREGDVLGQAQSGVRSSLRMLAVIEDEEIIEAARAAATALVADDPELERMPELRTALSALLDEEREDYLDKG
ncbi:ATP-dependent DNA helicase RecG [Streptomyces sp. WMMB 714]|uniref:helicase-related protein n=1 Tax=Streptomyces sp. WMMB 714 TaxID=1286822 RepID=UPI0005F7B0A7|nr:helicase-related protein [Streptomyces sp. WMMB 714]SCK36363.1 ATP-dependent DNA helicase RecG [Streptomyces sp. WMMB 714]